MGCYYQGTNGHRHSEETKQKMSKAQKEYWRKKKAAEEVIIQQGD